MQVLQQSSAAISAAVPASAPAAAPKQEAAAASGASGAGVGPQAEEPQTTVSAGGETLWQLGGNKFASVSTFKGKRMVGLREHYQKDGKWMPGKKGISLSPDQFAALREGAQVRPTRSSTSSGAGALVCDLLWFFTPVRLHELCILRRVRHGCAEDDGGT